MRWRWPSWISFRDLLQLSGLNNFYLFWYFPKLLRTLRHKELTNTHKPSMVSSGPWGSSGVRGGRVQRCSRVDSLRRWCQLWNEAMLWFALGHFLISDKLPQQFHIPYKISTFPPPVYQGGAWVYIIENLCIFLAVFLTLGLRQPFKPWSKRGKTKQTKKAKPSPSPGLALWLLCLLLRVACSKM